MTVVSAGVHGAGILGGVFGIVLFQDGQRVHIGADCNNFATIANFCAERTDMIKSLADQFKENPAAVGVINPNAVIEVFVSQDGSWTILATGTDGKSCVLSAGVGWESNVLAMGEGV